jgi:alpha-N-acetylglucosaminidase
MPAGKLSMQIGAVERLAARVLGPELAGSFQFGALPDAPSRDSFELDSAGGSVVIRGNSGPALAAGLNWYLTRSAGAHVSWHGSHLGRVKSLPALPGAVRRESWARWRYFLNYCCYSYSLAFWKWEQWEPLIDWMALRGINMPLAMTGQEAVWWRVGRRLGLSESQIQEFLPGAAYLPFGWMGCLDGWTGPLSKDWIFGHETLGVRILERQRELGMTPVLQGFTGHVPPSLRGLFPDAKFQSTRWEQWETSLLDPMDPLFPKIAAIYMAEQSSLFGTDHLYAADTFIEMIPPSGDLGYLEELGRAIYRGMSHSDPEAVWILQGWPFHFKKEFWTQPRLKALLDAVPEDRLLLLDLYCEIAPVWEKTDAFCGKPWIWCNVQSFGQNVVMTGAFETNRTGLQAARRDPRASHLAGLGMVNEGLCQNPAAYDFLFEQAWQEKSETKPETIDLAQWGRDYAAHRYGRDLPASAEVWEILSTTVYRSFRAEESGLTRCPTFPAQVQTCEETASLVRAWTLLLQAAPELEELDTYRFDLVHVGRQVLSNLGSSLKKDLQKAVAARDETGFARSSGQIRELLIDLAALLSTRSEFCLEPWLAAAEGWASDETERVSLRRGALRQITLWADGDETLRDYARKEWAGLVQEFYLPRWEAWFAYASKQLQQGRTPDETAYRKEWIEWERQWVLDAIPSDPASHDLMATSRRLHARYAEPFL